MSRIARQELERLVAAVAVDLRTAADRREFGIEVSLRRAGCSEALVRPLGNFIPEAFGNVVLHEVGITVHAADEYQLVDGSRRKHRFDRDQLWLSVGEIATRMASDPAQRPAFALIAAESSAIDALNRLTVAGDRQEGATYTGILIGMPDEYEPPEVL